MRQQWQIDQGKRCLCKGSDEYCTCQNISPETKSIAHLSDPGHLLDWMAEHHLPIELFREEETQSWVACDASAGTVLGFGATPLDALVEARTKEAASQPST